MSRDVLRSYHTTVVLMRTWQNIARAWRVKPNGSSAPSFKLPHELNQSLDRFDRHRIVNRGAHPADRPVSRQTHEARGGRLPRELLLDGLIAISNSKNDIHLRARLFLDRAGIIPARINRAVQKLGFRVVPLLHRRSAAFGFNPLQHKAHDVHGE